MILLELYNKRILLVIELYFINLGKAKQPALKIVLISDLFNKSKYFKL